MYKCDKCEYVSDRKYNLDRHLENVKHEFENPDHHCKFCNKKCSNKYNKTRHENICKKNMQNQAPNFTTIIVYGSEFLNEHVNIKEIEEELLKKYTNEYDFMRNILKCYARKLFENNNNLYIKKVNKNDSYSLIHTGNNKWISELDKVIYPKIASNVANSFQEYLLVNNAELKRKTKKFIENVFSPFLDYMADEGYCADDDKEIKNAFKLFSKEIKLIIKDAAAAAAN